MFKKIIFVFIFLFVALLAGFMVVVFPPEFYLLPLVGGVVLFFILKRPELGLLVLLLLSYGIVPFYTLPRINLFLFQVGLDELLMLILVSSLLVRRLFRYKAQPISWSGWGYLYLYFLVIWTLALIVGYYYAGNVFAMADARRYFGWLFIIYLLYSEFTIERFNAVLRIVAIVGSILLVAQLALGLPILVSGRGSEELGVGYEDVVRGSILGGVFVLVYVFFYSILLMLDSKKVSYINYLVPVICLFGIVATFSRGVWAALFVSTLFSFIYCRDKIKNLIVAYCAFMLLCSAGIGVVVLLKPRLVDVTVERIFSVKDEGKKGTSVGARLDENEQALIYFKENMLIGGGHGAEYKKYTSQISRGFVNEAAFVHNGYLWIAVKFGLLGIFFVLFFIFKFFREANDLYKSKELPDENIRSVIAASLAMIASLVNAVSSPTWAQYSDLVSISLFVYVLILSRKALGDLK